MCLERPDQDDSKTGWKKMADAYRNLPEEAGLPWVKASGADGKAADGHTGRFQNRPAGVSLLDRNPMPIRIHMPPGLLRRRRTRRPSERRSP